jgi:nucleoside-diphosphate-sugar epimerase
MAEKPILVTGAGGFIGGNLVADLRAEGHTNIRAVDVKPIAEWYRHFDDVDNRQLDLRNKSSCFQACDGCWQVYQFAADMGGMGFIENNKARCMLNVLINAHMLMAAVDKGVERFLFASSACIYNVDKQTHHAPAPLKEEDAYPAMPEDGYGWEKLFSERMCRHFREDFGLETRIVRYHNVYGPFGTWDGGREKAPAAICRKVIDAKETGHHTIEIWGDGSQTRSFMFIDDCILGTRMIMQSDIGEPINLGSEELVAINELVDIIEEFAGLRLERTYKLEAPKGVNGRNSDNTMIRDRLNWEPRTRLRIGLKQTFEWVYEQYLAREAGQAVVM